VGEREDAAKYCHNGYVPVEVVRQQGRSASGFPRDAIPQLLVSEVRINDWSPEDLIDM
jgi:hypothetical protein